MLNNNYQHLFDMAAVIFNDSPICSRKLHRSHAPYLGGLSPILVTISTSTGSPNQRVFCRLCSLRWPTEKSREGSNRESLRAIHFC